jgi:hypothetical protein
VNVCDAPEVCGELEVHGKPSMLPWIIGGAAVLLAFGALSRQKKP